MAAVDTILITILQVRKWKDRGLSNPAQGTQHVVAEPSFLADMLGPRTKCALGDGVSEVLYVCWDLNLPRGFC